MGVKKGEKQPVFFGITIGSNNRMAMENAMLMYPDLKKEHFSVAVVKGSKWKVDKMYTYEVYIYR
jgi:hypothetical protein